MVSIGKISKYDLGYGITKDLYFLRLETEELIVPTLYLYDLLKQHLSETTVKNRASHLRALFDRLLTDFNGWLSLSVDSKNPENNRYVVANKVYKKVTESYMSGYLTKLSTGELSRSGKALNDKTIGVYIETYRSFFDFCYKQGFLSEKKELNYRFSNGQAIKTSTVGLNEKIHNLYYPTDVFNKVIGHIQTKDPFLKQRDLLALKMTYFMGLRPHEIFKEGNFTISRLKEIIDKDAPFNASAKLKISGKGRGGIGKIREVVITPGIYSTMKNFIYKVLPKFEARTGLKIKDSIFVKLNGENYYGSINLSKDVWKKAVLNFIVNNDLTNDEIEVWMSRNLYTARHCFATNLIIERIKEGKKVDHIAVKELMGHSTFTTTLASYIYIGAVLAEDRLLESKAIELYDKASKKGYDID